MFNATSSEASRSGGGSPTPTTTTSTNYILKGNTATAATAGVTGVSGFESDSAEDSTTSSSTTMTRHLHFPSDPLNIDFDHGRIEILLHHNAMGKNWIPICGFDSYDSSDIIWDTSKCVTEHLLNNVTRCICPISGTYVVLLEQQKLLSPSSGQAGSVLLVITSCLCFIQSSTTFIVLVPLLYKHKCAVTFLKMQFCTAIATLSGTMIVGFSQQIPYKWNNMLTCAIGAILLLATCSLIGIILLISFGVSQYQLHLYHHHQQQQLYQQQQQQQHQQHQVYRKESGGSSSCNNNYYGTPCSATPPSTLNYNTTAGTTTTTTSSATPTMTTGSSPFGGGGGGHYYIGDPRRHVNGHNNNHQQNGPAALVAVGFKCAITFSWILPTLYCIIIWLIRHVMRTHAATWWLKFATVECNLLIVNQVLLGVIFYLVYGVLVRRLLGLVPRATAAATTLDSAKLGMSGGGGAMGGGTSTAASSSSLSSLANAAAALPPSVVSSATRRVGLLVRLGIVYTLYLLVAASYLTYLNYKTSSLEYLTGTLQFLMGSAVLISFAIHPEKAPKPLNRKSAASSSAAAAASNLHNLNILERDSIVGGGGGGRLGGIPEASSSSSSAVDPATVMLLGVGGGEMDLTASGGEGGGTIFLSHHQHQLHHHRHHPHSHHLSSVVNSRIVAYNHQALLSSLSPAAAAAAQHQHQHQLQHHDQPQSHEDFHMVDDMALSPLAAAAQAAAASAAAASTSSRFTVRDMSPSCSSNGSILELSEYPPPPPPSSSIVASSVVAVTVVPLDHHQLQPQQQQHHLHHGQETCSGSEPNAATMRILLGEHQQSPSEQQEGSSSSSSSNNMLDRITDDLNFLLNGCSTAEDMMTFTPSHLYHQGGSGGKQKLPTIQENMVGICEEFEMRAATQTAMRQGGVGGAGESSSSTTASVDVE